MCVALAVVFGFEMLGVFTDRYVTITAAANKGGCRTGHHWATRSIHVACT